MNRIEAAYQSQLDLKSYPTAQLRNLAGHFQLPTDLPEEDLVWVIAITLLSNYRRAEMPVEVDYGKFTDQLAQINAMYHDIAERLQVFADEAGLGVATARHFDGEAFIQYAIDNDITGLTVDEIYVHQITKKLEQDLVLQEELSPTYPLSKSGKQCTTNCTKDPHGNCYCNTEPYTGWTGTYNWDYCNSQDCATRTIAI